MKLIFDSSALIAYLKNEDGAEIAENLLYDMDNSCYIHAVNLCEVYYEARRCGGEETALATLQTIYNSGLHVIEDMDEDFWLFAGRIKADYKRVSLADCFCISLSNRLNAEIITSDTHELLPLADAGLCKVRFIR